MIIISNKPGQLANLLFIYAHILSHGMEFEKQIINPSFYQYRSYFKKTSRFSITGNKLFYLICNLFARALTKLGVHNRLINAVSLDWHQTADLNKSDTLDGYLCFVQGWLFRSDHLIIKHKFELKAFFLPETTLQNKIEVYFKTNFTDLDETIIGIHVRQGDYKTFEGGKYFFSMEAYINVMQQLKVLFKEEKLRFLICSNETIKFEDFDTSGLTITKAPHHELLDMYCLARCNYITGPPSTYSMWASFYGDVPLCQISNPKTKIDKKDFKVYLSPEN